MIDAVQKAEPEQRRILRWHTFTGAVLAMLSMQQMRASEVGSVLYGGGLVATARARGGLLALRQDGLVDSSVADDRARWRITDAGRAWLAEALRIVEEA